VYISVNLGILICLIWLLVCLKSSDGRADGMLGAKTARVLSILIAVYLGVSLGLIILGIMIVPIAIILGLGWIGAIFSAV
jgi:hypothetical protein